MLSALLVPGALFGILSANPPALRSLEITDSAVGSAVELLPQPPPHALEEGLTGEVARFYGSAISALRSGQTRRALNEVRQARVLAYRVLQNGPGDHKAANRQFARVLYLEEQLSELVPINEQLERPPERVEQRGRLIQIRALLLHNMFLAVRGFLGVSDAKLLKESLHTYQLALDEEDNLKQNLIVGHAAMLAERGSRHEAQVAFAKLSEHDREQEALDIPIAYYYLALGDRERAIARLLVAAQRDSWMHGSADRDSHRSQVYRMNDFDRLRDHPRFIELVTIPEEQ